MLRRQTLHSPPPAAAFARSAWVSQSGSSSKRPTLLHRVQGVAPGTRQHLQVGSGYPQLPRARAEGSTLGGVAGDSSGMVPCLPSESTAPVLPSRSDTDLGVGFAVSPGLGWGPP